ncbi:MAG: hypothetical protein NC114_06765 [Ruminococcus flavefaciens]|nr:hypothetical protein [Ruminococcus flavefaciens]
MATVAIARLGAILKIGTDKEFIVNEGDCIQGLVYNSGKTQVELDGCVRVICARTTNYTGGPTDCPPNPYTQNYISVTQLIIDASTEHNAMIHRVNVSDIVDISKVLPEHGADDGTVPTTTVGGENSEYKTLQDAIDAMERGDLEGELSLEADMSEMVTIKGDVTINLNGHTLTPPANESNAAYNHVFVVDGGNLTINGEGEVIANGNQSYCVFNAGPNDNWLPGRVPSTSMGEGTVTINGGTFRQAGEDLAHNGYCIVNHGASMTINDGEFGMEFNRSSLIANGYQGTPESVSVMTINGGTFNGGRHTLNNDHGGVLKVTGGTFIMGEPWDEEMKTGPKNVLRNEDTGKTTVTGGTFTGNVENSNEAENSLVISGGTFTADVKAYLLAGCTQDSTGKVSK